MWSEDLRSQAQTVASHCRFTPPDDRQVGWNAQSVPAKTISLLDVIHLWYRQGEDFDFERAQCAPNRTCHHYTQVRGWYIYCIYNIWTHDHYPYMGLWEIPFKNHGHYYGVAKHPRPPRRPSIWSFPSHCH